MRLTKEQVKQWTSALRRGEYTQCKGHLHKGGGYCCLGVLAKEVLGYKDSYLRKGEKGPSGVYQKISELVPTDTKIELICMNDDGKSFNEIAGKIEELYA